MIRVSLVKTLPFVFLLAACAETTTMAPVSPNPPRPILDDEDPWSMIPAEADLVLWADLAKLRKSPWTKDSFSKVAMADTRNLEVGFDQIRDMDRLVFAKVPTFRDGASVMVAQGRFDRERIGKVFADKSRTLDPLQKSSYRGADLLIRGEEALAFLGRRTLLSGLTVAVRAAIDCNIGIARAIDSESWLQHLRSELAHDKEGAAQVVALYVRLQPATREALMHEMGEGESLEEFGGRIDLSNDLDATVIGVQRTEIQARDLAARMAERIREVITRPIVSAFGFTKVLDSVRFVAKGNRVMGRLHISQQERAEIAERMTIVADTIAKMRAERAKTEEKKEP